MTLRYQICKNEHKSIEESISWLWWESCAHTGAVWLSWKGNAWMKNVQLWVCAGDSCTLTLIILIFFVASAHIRVCPAAEQQDQWAFSCHGKWAEVCWPKRLHQLHWLVRWWHHYTSGISDIMWFDCKVLQGSDYLASSFQEVRPHIWWWCLLQALSGLAYKCFCIVLCIKKCLNALMLINSDDNFINRVSDSLLKSMTL